MEIEPMKWYRLNNGVTTVYTLSTVCKDGTVKCFTYKSYIELFVNKNNLPVESYSYKGNVWELVKESY